MNRTTTAVLALTTGAALAAGVSGAVAGAFAAPAHPGHTATVAVATAAKAKGTITIHNYGFSGPGTLKPKAVITVHNKDAVAHTVTANNGAFSVKVGAHKTVTFKAPKKAGTYAYHCAIHPEMHGSLRVS